MKLFSKNSNLYDHDTSTLQTEEQTTWLGNTGLRCASRGKTKNWSVYEDVMTKLGGLHCRPPCTFTLKVGALFTASLITVQATCSMTVEFQLKLGLH